MNNQLLILIVALSGVNELPPSMTTINKYVHFSDHHLIDSRVKQFSDL